MKYKIFFKNNEVKECETLEQCISCIASMLNALGNDYAKSDFKIYMELDQELTELENIKNVLFDAYKLDKENKKLKLAKSILEKFFTADLVYVELNYLSFLVDGTISLSKEEYELLQEVLYAEN